MSYEASQASTMSNNIRLAYGADGTAMYAAMGPPTSSPSPTPTYNNPNDGGAGGGDGGENNSAMVAVAAGITGPSGSTDVMKRKRGRPRKYAPDVSMPPSVSLASPSRIQAAAQGGELSTPALVSGKKARGRPPGSANKQQPAASGSPGSGFTPHILDVKAGEDVLAKLMWFSQNSPRALCVLSANGAVSNVTLRQPATSGGTVTYEGRFEILSLSGSFMVSENSGQRSRTGGLSVALAGPDGRVLGGNVAGLLTAASAVQVVVGSFVPHIVSSRKQPRAGGNEAEVVNASANPGSGTSAGGSLSESSGGGLGSPLDQSNNSNAQGMASMPWR